MNQLPKDGNDIFSAARAGKTDRVRELLDAGVPVNHIWPPLFGTKTPLRLASEKGHVSVVMLLLERGADTEAKDELGGTALFYAATEGHESVIKELVEHGAKLNAKFTNGATPMDMAELALSEGKLSREFVSWLRTKAGGSLRSGGSQSKAGCAGMMAFLAVAGTVLAIYATR